MPYASYWDVFTYDSVRLYRQFMKDILHDRVLTAEIEFGCHRLSRLSLCRRRDAVVSEVCEPCRRRTRQSCYTFSEDISVWNVS